MLREALQILVKRVTDTKTGETMVVAIGGHPFTAAFNGQCGEKGIWNEIAFNIGGVAQATKDVPVARPRIDDAASRLVAELSCERDSLLHATWRIEHTWMGDDSDKAAQHQIRQAIGMVGIEKVFKPPAVGMMMRRILTVGIHEHIDVKKNHVAVP